MSGMSLFSTELDLKKDLDQKHGHLEITSDIPGIRVFLDGKFLETTPVQKFALPTETYLLSFRYKNELLEERIIEIEEKYYVQTINILDHRAKITLKKDYDAIIQLNDTIISANTYVGYVKPGKYSLSVTVNNEVLFSKKYSLSAGDIIDEDFVITKNSVSDIEIKSASGKNYPVYIGNDFLGNMPCLLKAVPAGDYEYYTVIEGKNKYFSVAMNEFINPKIQKIIGQEYDIIRKNITIKSSTPTNYSVSQGSQLLGITPLTLTNQKKGYYKFTGKVDDLILNLKLTPEDFNDQEITLEISDKAISLAREYYNTKKVQNKYIWGLVTALSINLGLKIYAESEYLNYKNAKDSDQAKSYKNKTKKGYTYLNYSFGIDLFCISGIVYQHFIKETHTARINKVIRGK